VMADSSRQVRIAVSGRRCMRHSTGREFQASEKAGGFPPGLTAIRCAQGGGLRAGEMAKFHVLSAVRAFPIRKTCFSASRGASLASNPPRSWTVRRWRRLSRRRSPRVGCAFQLPCEEAQCRYECAMRRSFSEFEGNGVNIAGRSRRRIAKAKNQVCTCLVGVGGYRKEGPACASP
jgi:hypothetical protein